MRILAKVFFPLILLLSACGPVTPPTPVPQEYQDFAYQMVWAPDDSMIALTTNTGLYVYDTKTYKQLAAIHELAGGTAVFSRNYLAAVNHQKLFVWDLKDFRLLFRQEAKDGTYFQNVAISPDEKTLATAEQKQVRYWSLAHGTLIAEIPGANFISDMVFSATDRLILADPYLGTVQEWDVQARKEVRAFGVSKPVVNFNLSQDGKLVVVDYGDNGFETWNVETGQLDGQYPDIIGAPGWNNLSRDGQRVVVWGYGIGEASGLSVWELPGYKKISQFPLPIVHGDGWRCGALNSDGTILAASDNQGYIYFYNLKSNEKVGEIFLSYKFMA